MLGGEVDLRDDELDDQFAVTGYDRTASSPVSVLPANAIVLLMQTDDIRSMLDLIVSSNQHAIKVLDHTETIASKGEIVGTVASSAISKVKGLLPVKWIPSVGVWDRHLADGKAVEHAASVVGHVVDDGAFAGVESDSESPSLPFD